jgi:hypothetical protein
VALVVSGPDQQGPQRVLRSWADAHGGRTGKWFKVAVSGIIAFSTATA